MRNPILAGDHPDPTILRVGQTYWTASTSGDWAPDFPLYHSNDLHHWVAQGAVFPNAPEWASGSFWAPELVADHGRIFVYYVARKRDGPLCVAVASAHHAEGPYTDHGPILCQPDGSIDPSFVRDEYGKPFLIWKEDANSEGRPTPIFAQPLTKDLLHLTGTPTQLLINDPESWEGGVVEGPYIFRHEGRFYLFYAGNACCGAQCNYAEGVARSERLLGPWEKDPDNPIIRPNAAWKCPGHGTAVETPEGREYLLYHAYPTAGTVYLGRESVLDEITWGSDGWPVINQGKGPSGGIRPGEVVPSQSDFTDDFSQSHLDPEWKWPVHHAPALHVGRGQLTLQASPGGSPAFLGRSLMAADYVASVGVSTEGDAKAALGLIGGAENQLELIRSRDKLELLRLKGTDRLVLWQAEVPNASIVWLRISSSGRAEAIFSYSLDCQSWSPAGDAVTLTGLPAWDEGLRIGLLSTGRPNTRAKFKSFSLLVSPNRE